MVIVIPDKFLYFAKIIIIFFNRELILCHLQVLDIKYANSFLSLGLHRFDEKENVSNCIQLKTSVIKGIKNQLLDQFPKIDDWLNQILPKKDPVKIVRW